MTEPPVVHFVNRQPLRAFAAPSREPLAVQRWFPAFAPTPLHEMPALAEALGVRHVWVKDESLRMGLPSFKILGASWSIFQACRRKLGLGDVGSLEEWAAALSRIPGVTLIAATDGNHGRAVAHVARLLGVRSTIYVPAGTAPARVDAIRCEGADVRIVAGGYDAAVSEAARAQGPRHLLISDVAHEEEEGSPSWAIEGYGTLFQEVERALMSRSDRASLSTVFVPVGVGALCAAAVRHFRQAASWPEVKLVGVEPLTAACSLESVRAGRPLMLPPSHASIMAGLNCATPSRAAWPELSLGMDAFLAIGDDAAEEAVRSLGRVGLRAGETGAASLAGAFAWKERLTPEDEVLVLLTEGPTDPGAYARIVGALHRA